MATQTLTLIGSKEVRACRNPPGLFQKVPGKELTPLLAPAALSNKSPKLLSCGKLLSKLHLLPECRADGMADVRDLKSRGDFPRVGSTPTPGTTLLLEIR